MLTLQFPNESHKNDYEKLIKEWGEAEKIPTTPTKLFDGENFEEFLSIIKNDTVNNKFGVNSHLFFLVDDEVKDEIIGAIQVRHHINHPNLVERGGHIGYGIAPKFRGKGLAKTMLKLGIEKAKELGIKEILLTCDITNIPSNKVIQKNGGIFERITKDSEANRYWINL